MTNTETVTKKEDRSPNGTSVKFTKPEEVTTIGTEDLQGLRGFFQISPADLKSLVARFPFSVNITGFSGQGIHVGQREMLGDALSIIASDQGWNPRNTILISGGTALGTPHLAIEKLANDLGFPAAGVMAAPGVKYPLSRGYLCICVDPTWTNWGDETKTMGDVSNTTLLMGGGAQALSDALYAAKDGEKIVMIVNAYNNMAKIAYRIDEKRGDVMVDLGKSAINPLLQMADIHEKVRAQLSAAGVSDEELAQLKITDLPVSGLMEKWCKSV